MNHLRHIDEFRSVLADYALSTQAKATLAATPLVLLVGPSSSGRNTIIAELLRTGGYHFIVTDTTRQPRTNNGVLEENGREYWFRSEEEVLADLRRGAFLEAAIIHAQQVSGVSIREIENAHASGQVAITDIDPNGAATIHAVKPDTTILFVLPPDFKSWMSRLRTRSDMPEDEIRRRLEAACKEIEIALAHDYYTFIVNDRLEAAVAEADALIRGGTADVEAQTHARQRAAELYAAAEAYLHTAQI